MSYWIDNKYFIILLIFTINGKQVMSTQNGFIVSKIKIKTS